MKKTYKEIKYLDAQIKNLNETLVNEQNWLKTWEFTFSERQHQLKEIERIKSEILDKKKERLSKLETLSQNTQFEIELANQELTYQTA